MTKKIAHGLPKQDHFVIIQPNFNGPFTIGEPLDLEDKQTKGIVHTIIRDTWSSTMEEVAEGLCILAYNLTSRQVFAVLKDRYPEMTRKTDVKFLLLKKL